MQLSRLTLPTNAFQSGRSSDGLSSTRDVSMRWKTLLTLIAACSLTLGCGTTKFSDTGRTATEQLLISSAMEDLADGYDYSRLSGLKVFVKCANTTTDSDYLKSLIRQELAANGAFVKDTEEAADYIVEIAPGTVGTNRYELMYGIPETTVPAIGTLTTATSIPEFALIKRTDQKAQVKLVMWAYNKTTGSIIWQSGIDTKTAQIRDRWIFGAGPFSTATYDDAGIRLGGDQALPNTFGEEVSRNETASVRSDAVYHELDEKAIERLQKIREEGLANAVEDEEETLDIEESGEEVVQDESSQAATIPPPKESVASSQTTTPTKVASAIDPASNYELDLGYGSKINPGSVYVPPTSQRY
ncbi:MAG: hypothetical protein IK077_16910 [Thermoguttaceae bacterium]|nr:hypothetical protein [Thermoguttaceae bacterium]